MGDESFLSRYEGRHQCVTKVPYRDTSVLHQRIRKFRIGVRRFDQTDYESFVSEVRDPQSTEMKVSYPDMSVSSDGYGKSWTRMPRSSINGYEKSGNGYESSRI